MSPCRDQQTIKTLKTRTMNDTWYAEISDILRVPKRREPYYYKKSSPQIFIYVLFPQKEWLYYYNKAHTKHLYKRPFHKSNEYIIIAHINDYIITAHINDYIIIAHIKFTSNICGSLLSRQPFTINIDGGPEPVVSYRNNLNHTEFTFTSRGETNFCSRFRSLKQS